MAITANRTVSKMAEKRKLSPINLRYRWSIMGYSASFSVPQFRTERRGRQARLCKASVRILYCNKAAADAAALLAL